jgi:hypothetical protein
MSQYLRSDLVNKANPDIKVDLGYWCTSIARGIHDFGNDIFRYTESGIALCVENLKNDIEVLHNGIKEYRKHLRKAQEDKRENTDLLLRAQSKCVVEFIKEEIIKNEEAIADWSEEIEIWEAVENKLNFILDILIENEEEWMLVYQNR